MGLLLWMKRSFERYSPGLGAVLPWLGGALLLLALGFGLRSWNATRSRLKATATVTDNAASFAPAGGILYFPRIRFRTADGDIVQVLTTRGDEDAEFAAGEQVPVLYAANNPQDAVIATRWRIYKTAIVFAIAGVIVVDLGLLMGYGRMWLGFSGPVR
jgi:hypothetical protein